MFINHDINYSYLLTGGEIYDSNKANMRDLKAATGLQSGNAQVASKSVMFCTMWPWNLMDALGKQDRRWNADKPSSALDPYIPTWLTTSSANHRPANFWKSFFFFETLEGNCEKRCNLMLNWCGSISNLKLPFSDSWSTNNHRYYLSVYYGNVDIFSQYVTQM